MKNNMNIIANQKNCFIKVSSHAIDRFRLRCPHLIKGKDRTNIKQHMIAMFKKSTLTNYQNGQYFYVYKGAVFVVAVEMRDGKMTTTIITILNDYRKAGYGYRKCIA